MLISITRPSGLNEVVEAPDAPDPYHYVAPWEEAQIQTLANGRKCISHAGKTLELELHADEFGRNVYRGLLEG